MEHDSTLFAELLRADLLQLIAREGRRDGHRLPTAEQLAGLLGTSRNAVRRAISELEAQGHLTVGPRGTIVVKGRPEVEPPGRKVADLLDWMEFRTCVEVEAAGLAAQRRTEADLFRMELSLKRFKSQASTGAPAGDHDREFHYALATATANARFERFLVEHGERLIPQIAFGAAMLTVEARAQFLLKSLDEHYLIFEAISMKNPDAAREAMREHLRNTPRSFRDWLASSELTLRDP